MNLQFKQLNYNWGDTFYIYDENNKRKYFVKSSVMLWNRKWEICDLDKNVLVTIKKEPKSIIKKKYYISMDGHPTVTVTNEVPLLPKYSFDGVSWKFHGAMITEFNMLKEDGTEVLSFHDESTPWGYRPVLKVANPSDELLALAVVTTIGCVMNAKDSEESVNHV